MSHVLLSGLAKEIRGAGIGGPISVVFWGGLFLKRILHFSAGGGLKPLVRCLSAHIPVLLEFRRCYGGCDMRRATCDFRLVTFYLPPSTFHLPPSTFYFPPSTFRLPPSTFYLLSST